ncbi:hypothetical protein LCGC14_2831630, partial [marine sediment metagenome]
LKRPPFLRSVWAKVLDRMARRWGMNPLELIRMDAEDLAFLYAIYQRGLDQDIEDEKARARAIKDAMKGK